MDKQPTYIFLPEDQCLSESQLFDYIDGKLKASEMHLAEKHILSCGFCSDALEGLEKVKNRDKVAAFIPFSPKEDKEEKPKVIPLNPNRKYYAMAAAVVLLVALTFIMKLAINNEPDNAKMAELVQHDTIMAAPQKENAPASWKSDSLSPAEPDLQQGIVSHSESGNKNAGLADNRGTAPAPAPKMHDVFAPPVAAEKTAEKPDEEVADGEDRDDFTNVVDAKVAPQQDKYYEADKQDLAKLEQRSENQQKKAKAPAATKDANDTRANGALDEAPSNIAVTSTESKPATTGGTTTISNSSGASPQFSWNVPPSTTVTGTSQPAGNSTVMVTDSVSGYVANEKEAQGNLSYENGVKMLDAGQAAASLAMFDKVLQDPNHPHYQDAQWKKADALIQLKRNEEAKPLLNALAAKPGKYQQKAKDKLKTL